MKTLNELFEAQLKMLYSVEDQLVDALPKMVDNASDDQLQQAFSDHLSETKDHKNRLSEIAEKLDCDFSGQTCKAMKAIIGEAEDFLSCDLSDAVKDAGLIVHAQQVEHHEIAAYGSVCAMAQELGHTEIEEKLKKTLNEENAADDKLNDLAVRLNTIAMGH